MSYTHCVFVSCSPIMPQKACFFCWRSWIGIMWGAHVQSFCFCLFVVFLYLMGKSMKVEQMKGKYALMGAAQVNRNSSVWAGAQQKVTGLKWGQSITDYLNLKKKDIIMSLNYIKNFYEGCVSKTDVLLFFLQNQEIKFSSLHWLY